MALVTCPDCQTAVSDKAPSCVKCGRPMAAQAIEATGKVWKGIQVAGGAVVALSFVGCMMSFTGEGPGAGTVPAIVGMIAGLVMWLVGRMGAWWYHG